MIISFRIFWWIESSKELHLLEIEIIFNIINVFTVTFDPFDESLLNKNITLFFFMLLTPNIILNQVKYKQGVCLSAYKKHHRQTRVTH